MLYAIPYLVQDDRQAFFFDIIIVKNITTWFQIQVKEENLTRIHADPILDNFVLLCVGPTEAEL